MFVDELILKQLGIILISAVKFILAAPASYLFGFSYTHTIISTTIGGWIGVLSFFYGGRFVFSHFPQWKKTVRCFYRSLARLTHNKGYHTKRAQKRNKPVKIFTRRNRFIVKIRTRFGFPGLIILTPVLLSIPIGTFLIVKYYSQRRDLLPWLSVSVMAWSVILSTFIEIF